MDVNYFSPPTRSEKELHERYFNPELVLVMDDVLSSKSVYTIIFQELLDILKYGFEIREIRTHEIKFKFHKDDPKIHSLQIRHLVSNLILWRVFIDIDKVELLDESYLFDGEHFSTKALKQYIDDKLLPIHDGDFASKNAMIDDICHAIVCISHAFCLLMGMGFSMYGIMKMIERNPEMEKLVSDEIDESMSPDEIEKELNDRTEKLIHGIITDSEDNDLKPLLIGKDIKTAQFREFMVMIGFKSDMGGNTIPALIKTNFLMGGLSSPAYIYSNAKGGRKALILTKTRMGEPGAFSKKLSQATTSASMLGTEECCDSAGYVEYFIKDETFLRFLNGRVYYDQYGTMHILNHKKDKHLIGKIVPFRSPITCMGHDGICKACYGHLYDINKDMFSVGCLSALKVSEPAGQTVLSSKHQQSAVSSAINFSENFDQAFELTSTEVTLKTDSDMDADMLIRLGEVFIDEMDDSEFYYVMEFDLIDNGDQSVIHIKEEHDAKLYLGDQLLKAYKKLRDKSTPISLETLDEEESLFSVEIKSKELTEPIKIFQMLLNRNDHMGARTISELTQTFVESLVGMGTLYDFVAAECIVRAFVRKKSNVTEFPDFTRKGDPNDVNIVKLDTSLFSNPSVLVSMSYGYLRKMLVGAELYEKSAPSHADPFFVSRLSNFID